MIDAGFGLDPKSLLVMASSVLMASQCIAIALVTSWLLVSCLVKSVTSAVILAVVDLTICLEATVVTTYLTN